MQVGQRGWVPVFSMLSSAAPLAGAERRGPDVPRGPPAPPSPQEIFVDFALCDTGARRLLIDGWLELLLTLHSRQGSLLHPGCCPMRCHRACGSPLSSFLLLERVGAHT